MSFNGVKNADNFIKTREEQDIMREGGAILGNILLVLKKMLKPNLDTWELEKEFLVQCNKYGVEPSCKGYNPFKLSPFPTGLCLSINSECVHCYPKKGKILKDGDTIVIDTAIKYKGLHLDSAFSSGIGKISSKDQLFLHTAQRALYNALNEVKPEIRIGKISNQIYKTVKKEGFDVLREYTGHGIGKEMHEWPQILCYGGKNEGSKIKTGMTLCIESLCCTGNPKVLNKSSWETEMADGGKFVQFEHTVLVTKDSYEILTLPSITL